MSENLNLSGEKFDVFDKLDDLLKYQTINKNSWFNIYYDKNNLSYWLYKIFFDKFIYKVTAFSIFCSVLYQLNSNNTQLVYLFCFSIFVLYIVSFFYFMLTNMSNVSKTGILNKEPNILDLDIDFDLENIFVEQEKQKLVDLLNK
jgi:hypothetical protein